MSSSYIYCYLHGFGSGPKATKAVLLAEYFSKNFNISLYRPDLNVPSAEELNVTDALNEINKLWKPSTKFRLIGSSLGGYTAARYAELYPERVDRVLLLCPAFKPVELWSKKVQECGKGLLEKWKEQGYLYHWFKNDVESMYGATPEGSNARRLAYKFYQDLTQCHPPFAYSTCPKMIIHGIDDDIVSFQTSEQYCQEHEQRFPENKITLISVKDDHRLVNSMDVIKDSVTKLFQL